MTEEDIELLRRCAKVAGIRIGPWNRAVNGFLIGRRVFDVWNPFDHERDVLKLVVSREMQIGFRNGVAYAQDKAAKNYVSLAIDDDADGSLRRAVVLAVADALKE